MLCRIRSGIGRLSLPMALLLALGFMGCDSGTPQQRAEKLRDRSATALQDALAAEQTLSPGKARRAADRAQSSLKDLEALLLKHPEATNAAAIAPLVQVAKTNASQAGIVAERTRERVDLAEKTSTLTARAYRRATAKVIPITMEGLAAAAEQMDHTSAPENLPRVVRETAALATNLSWFFSGGGITPPSTSGTSVWAQVAADLRYAAKEPRRPRMMLAAGFYLAGQTDLALSEIEQVRPWPEPPSTNALPLEKIMHHALRSLIYASADFPRLSSHEAEILSQNLDRHPPDSPELATAVRFLTALEQIRVGEKAKADADLARLIQQHPNHPMVVYLTGERILADGGREPVADSLATFTGTARDPTAVKRLMERARAIRDGQTGAAFLVDDQLRNDLLLFYFSHAAKDSAAARQVQEWLKAAKKFSEKIAGHAVPETQ